MTQRKIKRKPTYKQMAFDTAVRNPERYIEILKIIAEFENVYLTDENLLQIVSKKYIQKIVSSKDLPIDKNTTIEDIKENVKQINSTRKADGGFPEGYCSRFWTYMRTPSELGFIYAQYQQPLKLSEICKKLISGKIDEQEAFSVQTIKYNRNNPYRNVNNDFNFFTFIMQILLKLNKENKSLSYEQFIVAMCSKDGNVDNFLKMLEENKFRNFEYVYKFVKKKYNIPTNLNTITKDYPDVVRRVFILCGFITIRFLGKKLIQLNKNKIDYIKKLLSFDFKLTENEKNSPKDYFEKLNTQNKKLLKIIKNERNKNIIDKKQYTNKIFNIIRDYKINEKLILRSIEKIGTKSTVIKEFREIPEPLKLEFFISILIALKYGKEYKIYPNYKTDHIGKPYSHAVANKGDIEVFSEKIYWLIEVTLIRNRTQQLNHETTNVIRHLNSNQKLNNKNKYLSFVAPRIHNDVKDFYDYSIVKNFSDKYSINIKPYSLKDFLDISKNKNNFHNMKEYTQNVIKEFKKN